MICLEGQGADRPLMASKPDEGNAGNMQESNNSGRTRLQKLKKGQQRLPPRQYLAVTVRRRDGLHRGFKAVRSDIVEGGRLHSASPESSLDPNFALPSTRTIQRPRNRGARFSAKARRPSLKSSLSAAWSIRRWAAATSRPPSPMDNPFSMNFAPAIESGALLARVPANARAAETASSLISSTRPIDRARAAS